MKMAIVRVARWAGLSSFVLVLPVLAAAAPDADEGAAQPRGDDEVMVYNGEGEPLPRAQVPGEGVEDRAWIGEAHRPDHAADPRQRGNGAYTRDHFGEPPVRDALLPDADLAQLSVGTVRGSNVVNPRGDEIGLVLDLVIDRDQESLHALLDVGAWAGVGGMQIVVPIEQLEVRSAGEITYTEAHSPEQLRGEAADYRARQDEYVSIRDPKLRLSALMNDAPDA